MRESTAHRNDWWNDSPLTDRLSLTPAPPLAPSALTFAAFDAAEEGDEGDTVTWHDWVHLLRVTAGYFLSPYASIRGGEIVSSQARSSLQWHEVRRNGDFALELSRVLEIDNTYGARLVNWQAGTVLQYVPESCSTSVSVMFDMSPISAALPVMTDDAAIDHEAFSMEIDDGVLLAMDAFDDAADERYRAAEAREARALRYVRD